MRVDHVIDSLDVGGAETLVAALARCQHGFGHEVRVHCSYGRGSLADDLAGSGVDVIVHASCSPPRRLARLFRAFRAWRPDVVHCHNIAATVLAAWPASIARVPVILVTRHGQADPEGGWRRELKFWAAARACHRVVAVCDAARRNLARGPMARPAQLVTLLNGAPTPARSGSCAERAEGFVIISVARLSRAKDHRTLLEAIARARHEVPDLELWLVGEGPERAGLEALAATLGISGIVRFVGEQRFVGDWLARAHVFVLTSITEGVPLALLEALGAGVPAVVTDVGGMPEVLAKAGVGFVVPPRNPDALAARLVDLATRRHILPQLGASARMAFEQQFTLQRMYRDYDRLIAECRLGLGQGAA